MMIGRDKPANPKLVLHKPGGQTLNYLMRFCTRLKNNKMTYKIIESHVLTNYECFIWEK